MSYKTQKLFTVSVVLGLLIVIGATKDSARASKELAKDQVLVLGLDSGDIGTIDPMVSTMIQDRPMGHHVFSALVRHPIGNIYGGLEPDLATKWETSPDKRTWTFHLRRGVKWHWGYGELTSEDVVFSFNRLKNSKASAWRGNYDNFKEFKAIDKYTVQITTFKPEAFFLNKVANYFGAYVVCKKAAEKTGDLHQAMSPTKEQIVGTGPFKFLEYVPKSHITMVRNDDYWGGKPIIEKIIWKYIPDKAASQLACLKGEIAATRGVDSDKWIKHIRSKGVIAHIMGPTDLKTLSFNMNIKPLDDKRIRQAFAYAVSQEAIMEMQGKENSRIATGPIPSGLFGHIDAGWHIKRDPEKAKKLLAEAGYPNGLTIKCFMSVGAWYMDKMIVWQDQLRKCGINVEMTRQDHSVYKVKNRQNVNSLVMWGSKFIVPTYWLRDRFHSDSRIGLPTAQNNYSNYSNPEVDRLIELAETTIDKKAQLDALTKAQKLIVEDLPAIPVIETYVVRIRNPWFDLGYELKANVIMHFEVGVKSRILKH
jgi:peptide/nickel transport system substrate-binding protein